MSWHFSRALVEDCLAHKKSESEQSVLLNYLNIADAFLLSDKMSDTLDIHSRFGMTLIPLTAERGAAELILCLEGFLAKHLAEQLEEGITPKIYGLKCSE